MDLDLYLHVDLDLGTPSDFFWSSSPATGSVTAAAWGVSFNRGSGGTAPVDFPSRVRCVR